MSKGKKKGLLQPLVAWLVLTSLFAIVVGKAAFVHDEFLPLYIYGVLVTVILLLTFFYSLILYRDPYDKARSLPIQYRKRLSAACIVAVHNDEHMIAACIEALIGQTYDKKEIIVVDDASTDRSAELLAPYAARGDIRLIRLKENVGKKKALAIGMLNTRANVFVFSDSDSVVQREAVKRAVTIMNFDRHIGAVSGHVRAYNAEKNFLTKVQDTWYEGQFSIRKAAESCFGAVTCVSGPLAIFRREAIYNYIPAWEADTFLGNEFRFATDRMLTGFVLGSKVMGRKLQEQYADSPFVRNERYAPRNWKVVYSRSCMSRTRVPETFRQMLNQQIRWKKSFIRNIFFTGSFFWKKHPGVSLIYYSHILFVLLGPFIVFRHLVYMPLHESVWTAFLYFSGVCYIGCMFGLVYRAQDHRSMRWLYRPFMSFMSVFVFSWLIFYSAVTIRKMVWIRNA